MAAKRKQRKQGQTNWKMASKYKKNHPGAEDFGEEEDADSGTVKDENKEDELSLDEVLHLGGTRADYVMLAALEDSAELVDGGKPGAIDDLEEGELEKFISDLGIGRLAERQTVADEPGGSVAPAEGPRRPPEEEPEAREAAKEARDPGAAKRARAGGAGVFEFQQRQVLLIKPGGKWFQLEYCAEGAAEQQEPALVARYRSLAQRLLEAEVRLYRGKRSLQKGANANWMRTVVSSGTLADRMAAMTVLIQDAPVHSLEHVETLVSMLKRKGSRRMGLMALDTLRELLLSDLLPERRKLRPFQQRPFAQLEERSSGNRDARDRRLVLWYFEHLLKQQVALFVEALDALAHDTVQAAKAKALSAAHQLLCGRPEQEAALLAQLVDKLGDPQYNMAAKASYLLEALLQQHPNMKAVVCCEVERLLFRPNVGAKAQYYAVCFLGRAKLSRAEARLASRLVAVYFSFFRACLKKREVESRMLSALLAGVNRAFPYAEGGDQKVKEQLDTLFRVAQVAKFSTAVQALMLLFQVMDSEQTVSDRYYAALYRKLLDPGLARSSRQNMFLNLLYKSLKADVVLRRVKAFVKRLLQVGAEQSASFVCGALFLLSELMKAKPGLKLLLQEGGDEEDEEFRDLTDEDEGGECFADADEGGAGTRAEPGETRPAASWVHHQNREGGRSLQTYQPLHRNPLFCGADRAPLWELRLLSLHFHPSVALFARTILQGESVQYSGDPLRDFTLIRFLDRFVFRNPKQLKGQQNTGAPPPRRSSVSALPVTCEEFLSRDESQVPVDQVFFHRFFRKRQQEKQLRRRRSDGDEQSLEEVDDEEFQRMLDSCEGDSYFTGAAEEDLDFAGYVRTGQKKKSADQSDDSDLDLDLDDEEVSLGSMEEEDFGDEVEDEGGTFMDPDDDEAPELEEEEEDDGGVERSRRKLPEGSASDTPPPPKGPQPGKRKRKRATPTRACSEEFGALLDDNAGSKFDNIGMNAMATADRAGVKQLKWEAQRDEWIRGRDAQSLRRRRTALKRRRAPPGRAQAGGKARRRRR